MQLKAICINGAKQRTISRPLQSTSIWSLVFRVLQATFPVPRDAYCLDFVLSDVESGDGTYDNNGGLDYRLPVEGTVEGVRAPPLHVVHIAVEMAPIAKVSRCTWLARGITACWVSLQMKACLPAISCTSVSSGIHWARRRCVCQQALCRCWPAGRRHG